MSVQNWQNKTDRVKLAGRLVTATFSNLYSTRKIRMVKQSLYRPGQVLRVPGG